MRIRFLSTQVFETIGPGKGITFAEGLVLDESEVPKALGFDAEPAPGHSRAFLNRWLNRGVAEIASEAEPVLVKPSDGADSPALKDMTRAELDALAAKRGVDITSARNKDDVIAALTAASASAA